MEKGTITPAQCRAARAMLEWSQDALAEKSELSRLMIAQFEQGRKKRPLKMSLAAIEKAFTDAGVSFPDARTVRLEDSSDKETAS